MSQEIAKMRAYRDSDKDSCMEIFQSNVPKYFTLEEVNEFERFLTKLGDPEATDNPPYYVMELEDKLIGCGGFGKKKGIDGADAITFVWGMVDRSYHKQGYGAQLLQFRLAEIPLHFPGKPVILDTTQFSYSFFEKYGFRTVKITENSYGAGMHRYDMVLDGSKN